MTRVAFGADHAGYELKQHLIERLGAAGYEIIDHGTTGFIVQDQAQAVAAARGIARIDRRSCRASFERRFAAPVMARNYLECYRTLTREAERAVA